MSDACASTGRDCHRFGFSRGGVTETFVTVPGRAGWSAADLFGCLRGCLGRRPGARVVRESLFGLVDGRAPLRVRADGGMAPSTWPVTEVTDGGPAAGLLVHAVDGVPVEPLRLDGRVVGSVFEDAFARYVLLGDLRPEDPARPREEQASRTFAIMEEALRLAGLDFSHVVRTWFFLDDILAWYDGFNRVRTGFFRDRRVFDGLVPASTGVGCPNVARTAVVAEAIAIRPKDPRVRIEPVPSPLQCPALEYGSSFSRAVEVAVPGLRRVLVSGTASIEPGGKTAHVGDVDAQTDLTMRVVGAILESRGLGWADVCRGIAYFKRPADSPALARWCAARGVPTLPVVVTKADICRDDLLFEIEMDALKR
jgi:enamine deaminase RidA (YjgF/YER057c/UK114 family)